MTSNLGTELIQDKISLITEENRDEVLNTLKLKVLDVLKTRMRPEFLNRIDEIIIFKPLTGKEIEKIAEVQMKGLIQKLTALGIKLEIDISAYEWLAKVGFDPQFGARPLKRAIQKSISDVLAIKLLSSEFVSGDIIHLSSPDSGGFKFTKIISA